MENYIYSEYTYIDLGFIPQVNDRLEVVFSIINKNPEARQDYSVWGAYYNGWNGRYEKGTYMFSVGGLTHFASYCGGAWNPDLGPWSYGDIQHVSYTPKVVNVNGTNYNVNGDYQPQTTYTLRFGTAAPDGVPNHKPCACNWYSIKIYRDDVLFMDIIPWMNSDGHGCFKDTLTGTIYNAADPTKVTFVGSIMGVDISKNDFDYAAEDATISISAPDMEWNITSSNWISVSQTSGTDDAEVLFTVSENRGSYREGFISVTIEDTVFDFNITQKANMTIPYKALKYNGRNLT